MSERAHLFAALAKAQQAAKGIEKSGENKFHHYKYASAEDVVAGSRAALGAHALAFLSTSYKVGVRDGMLMLESRYLLTHESGESIEVESETPIIPDKGRPEDKATATAKTYDLAYALRSLLLLPRVEEGADVDSRDDTKYQPRERPSPAQIQEEARGPSKLEQWRNFWNEKLGAQLFADTVGVDVKQIHSYVLPKDKTKRDAVLATLESVRRDLDALSEVPA